MSGPDHFLKAEALLKQAGERLLHQYDITDYVDLAREHRKMAHLALDIEAGVLAIGNPAEHWLKVVGQ